jgi:hypothetical protein
MMKLVSYPNNKEEVHSLWDAEVVYLGPGDFMYVNSVSAIIFLRSDARLEYSPLVRFTAFTHLWKALRRVHLSSTWHQCTIQRGPGIWTTKKQVFSQIKHTHIPTP